jgi:hypothetical protein
MAFVVHFDVIKILRRDIMKHQLLPIAVAIGVGLGFGSAADAKTIIDFSEAGTGANVVHGTAAGGVTTITATDALTDISFIISGGAPFDNVFLDLHAVSTGVATLSGGEVTQDFSGSFSITSLAGGLGTNYLSGTFSDSIFGFAGGTGLTLQSSDPPNSLAFTSSVIPAGALLAPSSLEFTFSNVTPGVGIVGLPGSTTLRSFTSSFTGSADAVPEPSTWAMMLAGFAGLGFLGFRQSRKTRASLV